LTTINSGKRILVETALDVLHPGMLENHEQYRRRRFLFL
jgi:hypothetical protein